MKRFILNHIKMLLTLLLGVSVFLFWRFGYPQAISFNEELQLFLFDADYLTKFITYSGGIAVGIGAFLMQFYSSLTMGALILAIVSIALQRLTWLLACKQNTPEAFYVLSFLPSIFLLHIMGNENIMLGVAIAIIISLVVCLCYSRLQTEKIRWIASVGFTIGLYLVAGFGVYMFVFYLFITELQKAKLSHAIVKLSVAMLSVVVCIIICYRFSLYPLSRIATGMINFYRFKVAFVADIAQLGLVSVATPFVISQLKRVKVSTFSITIACISVALLFIVASQMRFSDRKYIIMNYDMLLRQHNWDGIIHLAQTESPQTPLEVYSVNFALAMRGELADRLFEFPQHSPQGLIPTFKREITYSLMANEVYFSLGMINTAQRFVFEAQESIPNDQKSGRMMRRLVETNMLNGQYDVAKRYLNILLKTISYRKWAKEMLTYLGNEQKINDHPFYGEMRQLRVINDFFYSDEEVDQMLGLLFIHNKTNRLALDYLLCYELLSHDNKHFMKYYPLTSKLTNYNRIPKAYQEALVYSWAQNHNSFDGIISGISPQVKSNFTAFVSAYQKQSQDINNDIFRQTYWYYMLLNNK